MSDSDGSDGYDWPEDTPMGRKLATLEENLLCPICSGLFNNPHVLRCGHSYCSICIRKHFDANLNRTSSDTCPSCREKADSFDLKKNSQLSSIVRAFRALRPDMLTLMKDVQSVLEEKSSAKRQPKVGSFIGSSVGAPITRRLPHYNFHGVKKDKVKSTLVQLTSESKVQVRLDGDKDVLERRVRAFVHLSNSQVGSDTPLGLDQVVRQLNLEETQMEKESNKSLRSAGKIELIRSGVVVKDVENGFQDLAQKVREQKEAALKKIANAAASSSSTSSSSQSQAQTSASDPPSSSSGGVSSNAQVPHAPGGVSVGGMDSAQLVAFLEQQVDRGYDWGPWRVVMSRRLGRPFFYNSVTKIGQFAVPPELHVIPSPSQSQQASQSSPTQPHHQQQHHEQQHHHQQEQQFHHLHGEMHQYMPMQAPGGLPPRDHLNASQMAFDHYHASHPSEVAYSGHSHQPVIPHHLFVGSGAAATSGHTADEGVVHYDHYLDEEEESPFHLLWDSSHHDDLDELDPASFLLPDRNHSHSHSHAGSGSSSCAGHGTTAGVAAPYPPATAPATAPTQAAHTSTATATSSFTSGVEATAVSTAMDVPNSTPFPRGGVAYTDLSATSSLGSARRPSTPWVVVDDDVVPSSAGGPLSAARFSQSGLASAPFGSGPGSGSGSGTGVFSAPVEPTSWACQACTFHNPMTTYTCDMCSTVDVVMQQSFSRPLLRSHQHTPVAASGGFTGRSQRLSQSTTQAKLTGKTKPPASAVKSSKKTKR